MDTETTLPAHVKWVVLPVDTANMDRALDSSALLRPLAGAAHSFSMLSSGAMVSLPSYQQMRELHRQVRAKGLLKGQRCWHVAFSKHATANYQRQNSLYPPKEMDIYCRVEAVEMHIGA